MSFASCLSCVGEILQPCDCVKPCNRTHDADDDIHKDSEDDNENDNETQSNHEQALANVDWYKQSRVRFRI